MFGLEKRARETLTVFRQIKSRRKRILAKLKLNIRKIIPKVRMNKS